MRNKYLANKILILISSFHVILQGLISMNLISYWNKVSFRFFNNLESVLLSNEIIAQAKARMRNRLSSFDHYFFFWNSLVSCFIYVLEIVIFKIIQFFQEFFIIKILVSSIFEEINGIIIILVLFTHFVHKSIDIIDLNAVANLIHY